MNKKLQLYAFERLGVLDSEASLCALYAEQERGLRYRMQEKRTARAPRRAWVAALSSVTALFLVAVIALGVIFTKTPTSTFDPGEVTSPFLSDAEGVAFASGTTYGEIIMDAYNVNYSIGEELRDDKQFPFYYWDFTPSVLNGVVYPTYWETKSYPIRDLKDAETQDVTYITDNRTNGIVTTKWMFYYFYRHAVLRGYDRSMGVGGAGCLTEDKAYMARYRCFVDDYCMEKVNIDVLSLIRPDEGKSLRDYTDEEMVAVDRQMASREEEVRYEFLKPYLVSPVTSNRTELPMAALARYGAYSPDEFLVSSPVVRGLFVTIRDERGYRYSKTLRIVGYIETEADKLLSSGVSMDETSAEYQTVLRQLRAPAFYSVVGNVMAAK